MLMQLSRGFTHIPPLRELTQVETDQSKRGESQRWEWRWLAPLPDREPAMRSSMRMSRQTTCPAAAYPPGDWGQRLTPLWVWVLQSSHHRNNNRAGGPTDAALLRQACVARLKIRPSPGPRTVSIVWAENSPMWSISHLLNRPLKNAVLFQLEPTIYKVCVCDLSPKATGCESK